MKWKIALLPGDGIGPEVVEQAVKILKLVGKKFNCEFEINSYLMGGVSIDQNGVPLTDKVVQNCLDSDAVLLGAVGGPKWESMPHHLKPEAGLLKIRKALELYANIRPAKVYSSLLNTSSLKSEVLDGTDVLILRELTGDVYFGEPRGLDEFKGWNTMIYHYDEVERITRKAFELAANRRKIVTNVDKANVLETSQFWRKIVHNISKDFPDIEVKDMYVDNAAMQLVRNPKQFDVILTQNLFGDILSDIAAMITGSLGMLPSASIGEKNALYEPVHGSAPDIAGTNKANPLGTISSVAMMFNYSFNLPKAEEFINTAVNNVLEKGYRTSDIMSEGKHLVLTTQMGDLISKECEKIFEEQNIEVL